MRLSYFPMHLLDVTQSPNQLNFRTHQRSGSINYRPQRSCGQGNVFTGVCLYTGGGCLPQCMLGCHTPPGPGRPTPPRWRNPSRWRTPPGPGSPPDGGTRPGPGRPPWMENPPGKQTPAYGLRAAGTHPTGMHSCSTCVPTIRKWQLCFSVVFNKHDDVLSYI